MVLNITYATPQGGPGYRAILFQIVQVMLHCFPVIILALFVCLYAFGVQCGWCSYSMVIGNDRRVMALFQWT